MRLPVADAYWRAADGSVRSHAPFDCGRIDEGFEARTSLSIRLNRIVEFVGIEVIATNHRDDFTRLRIERHHRALHGRNLREFNFQTPVLLVNFLDLKLREMTVLEFTARLPLAPTHVGSGQSCSEVSEAH